MSKGLGHVPNRLGLNYGSKASKVKKSPSSPIKMQDKIKELERRLEEQYNQNGKIQDTIKDLERRLEEQYDRNETIQKTRDQKFEYYNRQIEKLDESVQKLTDWASQLKNCIAEDIQRQYREREAQNKIQDVQHAMQKILATIMEQQHKHISDMIEFQTQLPDMIRGELSIQQASNPEPLLDRDLDVDTKPTQWEQDDAKPSRKTKTRTKATME
ncbi:hypothetical protein BCON_0015g00760 [Botryotinia convoluta]|uniref:Uncharacterized protein n=1 Tax=Botryotinia convoluta TaxID=54673 RepID=A0A4Z1J2S1_9HELO|nr:hypothetical protein BCON_0015g00760 [Botryotinia convoluta]